MFEEPEEDWHVCTCTINYRNRAGGRVRNMRAQIAIGGELSGFPPVARGSRLLAMSREKEFCETHMEE